MSYDTMLLVDNCFHSGFELSLCESASRGGPTKFRGKFQEAEAVNKNKRMYPYTILDENVKRLQEALVERRLIGELDHPADSIIHFANASHLITKLWWEGNVLMGEGEILNTPMGKVLQALIDGGVKVGISSRGVGNGQSNEDGILVIGESFKLITFDVVADPSCYAAFQEKVVNHRESVAPSRMDGRSEVKNLSSSSPKNEDSRIDNNKCSKDALIACVGGIIKSHTESIRSRLDS